METGSREYPRFVLAKNKRLGEIPPPGTALERCTLEGRAARGQANKELSQASACHIATSQTVSSAGEEDEGGEEAEGSPLEQEGGRLAWHRGS